MRGSKESLGQTNYPFVLSLLLQCLQCKKEENLESCCFPPESQQFRDVGPSRDLGLREGNGGGLVLLQADEEDHQDLRDEDRQPGQRHHSHRRPGLRFRLLRIRLKKSHTIHAVLIVFFFSSASMRRYEEQIRVLQEDLESEMTLRRRVEHEKQGLQMQVCINLPLAWQLKSISPDYLSVRASH